MVNHERQTKMRQYVSSIKARKFDAADIKCFTVLYQFLLPAETVLHILLPPRQSAISCFLSRPLSVKNGLLPSLSIRVCFLPRALAGSRITETVLAESHLSRTTVSAENKRLWTISAEAKYNGQSRQEAKICKPVYRKNSKSWDTSNNCHNCPKIGKV